MITARDDTDWHRFSRSDTNLPQAIARPPFYAIQYFPLSRKSMGGVAVDLSCRVLDGRGQPIPNLYAVVNWLASVASMAAPRSRARCSGRAC